MTEISERKANALNFLNPVLSTHQSFWSLNQWEASISGPLILTHFQNQTATSAMRQQSQQSDCNPPALQYDSVDCNSIVEIAVEFWRSQSDYEDYCLIVEIAV